MNVARPELNAISLCAGVGMLDEGVRSALDFLGLAVRTIAYGEWEAPAAAQLVALMEAGAVAPAPVWCGDFRRIDASRFRGTVDCVIAGFPCQDLSVAGRRAGLDGKRSGLFFSVADFADDSGAWVVVLENVAGIATATASVVDEEEGSLEERAAARVVGELADRGWHTEWLTVSASDVGASHGRERWFCLAWRELADSKRPGRGSTPRAHQPELHRMEEQEGTRSRARLRPAIGRPQLRSGDVADARGAGLARGRDSGHEAGRQEPDGHAGLAGGALFAPGPEHPVWAAIIERAPWLAPATESGVRLLADGMALLVDESRNHQVRQCGNGVVPLQAAVAVVVLARRAGLFG